MNVNNFAGITLAALLLAACGSAPVHLHTLVQPAPTSIPSNANFAISVQTVTIPAQVDVPQLVLRQGATGIALVETEQWSAPLADELRSALAAELSARLGVADVARLRPAEKLPVYRIRMDVLRFDSSLAGAAVIEALWTIQPPGSDSPALMCRSLAEVAVSDGGYSALVRSHQNALAKIAAQIAKPLARTPPSIPSTCPD